MKVFAFVILLFVSAVSWETDRTLEGSVGGAVDILCKYLTDPESVFLTKMNLSKNVTIIESTQKDQTVIRGRISLYHDSANRFITVAIKNLSREDAGIYRCGTTNYDGNPSYTEINLKVKHAPPTSKSQLTTGSTSAHSTPTGYTLQPKYTTAPGLESTSAYGNTNTADSGHLTFVFVRLVAAGLFFGLLHLTFFFMRSRVKGKEGSPSTYTNTRNIEEESSV